MILMPLPLQATHFCTAPALHNTFLLSCSFVVLPLYKSSRDTLFFLTTCIVKSLYFPPFLNVIFYFFLKKVTWYYIL
uniref:Uncharacterized protein n=1 Tax=Oryzias melastigma TaxID=30732 RepID=A0A3B3BLF0_ORYME